MDTRSKHPSASVRKSNTNLTRLTAIIMLCLLSFQVAACSRIQFIYPSDETATAVAALQIPPIETTSDVEDKNVDEKPNPTNTQTVEPTFTVTDKPVSPTPSSINTTTQANDTETPTPTLAEFPTISPTVTEPPDTTSGGNQASNTLSIIAAPILYYTQAGDTLEALSKRFGVDFDEIAASDMEVIPSDMLLQSNTLLVIPDVLGDTTKSDILFPDSEIIYSPSAIGFDSNDYVTNANGYMEQYKEWRTDGWYNGGGVIQRVSDENSVNPRLLLAVVEYQSHWVYGFPEEGSDTTYPLKYEDPQYKELYKQLTWTIMQVCIGYYGWRTGEITELTFPDETTLRLAPELNAGTVAIMYMFSKLYNQNDWKEVLYGENNFFDLYNTMFDDAWMRAKTVEPFFPTDLEQPELVLPFEVGKTWTFTGGPHAAWGPEGVMGALDFAPPSMTSGCVTSDEWLTAVASGVVTRSYNGAVVVDLDGDGYEQTGWAIFYMHVSHIDRVNVGDWVNVGDHIGHPSCEGGVATGTHVHIARKYNGEWIPADGPLPFKLNNWTAHNGDLPYLGTLTRGDETITADVNSSYISKVTREK